MGFLSNGPDRARTDDLFHAMEALSQLSYRPRKLNRIRCARHIAESSAPASTLFETSPTNFLCIAPFFITRIVGID